MYTPDQQITPDYSAISLQTVNFICPVYDADGEEHQTRVTATMPFGIDSEDLSKNDITIHFYSNNPDITHDYIKEDIFSYIFEHYPSL
jgi:hypothetical protein